ncbi:delta(1)-pyrroline-2-carboxylate/Delta(1)-piperid eine-2-carboxylate reductase [Vreelandella venusta]|uniref:Delta(1)-pyrroline-2-carboxylate/Delta(1)-piperid eine-2-carboxylate reductase n=1 Tax=Halomonas hydrothermalis TaxID=115561 RepID=A0A6F8U6S8_9GAMM|nr:Ldh family oxidoreductase [Halomonas hydrothermalis]BCB08851.1 delta(1)-pyrroline-2-carboxylate/Delta(1)-piperid eine-2-carboxylate reductase [Halomonas hydrothermalis]
MHRMSLEEAEVLAKAVLNAQGFNQEQTHALSQAVIAGQRDECHSHGLYRLLNCVKTLAAGKVVANAQPEVHDHAPGIVRVDAKGGFSQLAFEAGLPILTAKAREQGIAALAINHCVHFSALWVEIEAITDQGLVALACNPSHAWVAPAGGSRPLLGTNPLAFGWPRPNGQPPFIFDFATSAIARGDIELHHRENKPIPEGWGIDRLGQHSQNPADVLDGALLTFGGHKGSALSIMIELIAGPLIGDLTSAESLAYDDGAGASPYHGELILAMDPERFLGSSIEDYMARAENLFSSIIAQGARLPSQRRYTARQRTQKEGISIPESLYQELSRLARL